MKVKAIRSFVGTDGSGAKHRHQVGDVFDLPKGVDWLKAGFVEKDGKKAESKAKAED